MAIYRYKPGSLIDEMHLRTNESGGTRAYLHARADATPEQLQQVRAALANLGWKALPIVLDGKPMLEVRGFKKYSVAAQTLTANGWVVGNPSVEMDESDKRTGKDRFSKGTLKLSGIAYIFGDIMFFTYALKDMALKKKINPKASLSGPKFNIAAGLGYGLGSLSLLFYGSRDQSQNTIQTVSRKVNNYMQGEEIAVPKDSTLHAVTRKEKRGFLGSINHTLAKYPSEALNTIYVGVGAALGVASFLGVRSAMRGIKDIKKVAPVGLMSEESAKALTKLKHDRNENVLDIGLGAVTAGSALTGLLIKERKREPGEEKRAGLGRAVEWVQEKPLRATGLGYMFATALHGGVTFMKWHRDDPEITPTAKYRGLFAGANVVAEILLMMSSKGHGEGIKPDKSIDQSVIASVAEIIYRQPKEKHEQLIGQLSGYMSSREVLGGKAEDIAGELNRQLKAYDSNPWIKKYMPEAPAINAANDTITRVNDVAPATTQEVPGTKVAHAEHAAMLQHNQQTYVTQ